MKRGNLTYHCSSRLANFPLRIWENIYQMTAFNQQSNNTQCYNRYGNAINNPLKYTDPGWWSYGKLHQMLDNAHCAWLSMNDFIDRMQAGFWGKKTLKKLSLSLSGKRNNYMKKIWLMDYNHKELINNHQRIFSASVALSENIASPSVF